MCLVSQEDHRSPAGGSDGRESCEIVFVDLDVERQGDLLRFADSPSCHLGPPGPRNLMKITQGKNVTARSSEVEVTLDKSRLFVV